MLATHDTANVMHHAVVSNDGHAGIQRIGLPVEGDHVFSVDSLACHQRAVQLRAAVVQLLRGGEPLLHHCLRALEFLLGEGEFALALPWLEQAAPKAYGVNRLSVAQYRADALRKLGRDEDARQVVADALKANGPFFPDEVLKLKAVLG